MDGGSIDDVITLLRCDEMVEPIHVLRSTVPGHERTAPPIIVKMMRATLEFLFRELNEGIRKVDSTAPTS
jgi:hypothetical protein